MDSKERLEDHEMSGSTTNNSLGVPASTSSSNPPSSRSSHRRVSFDALSKAVHKRGISGYGNIPNSPATTSTPATGQIGSNGAGYASGPSLSPVPMNIGNSLPTSPVRASAGYRHHPTGVHPMSNTSSNNIPNAAYVPPLNVGVTGGSNNVNGSGFYSHSHPNSHPHASSSSSVASPPFHSQRPLMESLYSEFPFPALSALNRSRLLHLLEYQCRICEQVDKESLLHYRTLIQAIQSLNLKGGVYNFSFVHSSSIAHDLLGLSNPRSHYVTRLTVSHLLVILEKVRNSTSPNLAHPQSLPLALLETGIYYKPEEEQAKSMQLSPYVYHRTLAFLSLLMNLHIHQLTLSRILELLHGIDIHLDYWMGHQALTSLPKPYRLWKWFQYNWLGGVHRQSAASFASDFSGLHSPVKKRRTGGGGVAAGGDEKYEDEPQGSFGFPPNASSSSSSFSSSSASASTNPYSKWSLMAARNVRELVALKKLWTTRCGRIALRMHKLQQWLNDDFGKKPQTKTAASASIPSASVSPLHVPSNTAAAVAFHRHIELNELYFSKIYRYTLGEELHASSTSSSAPTIQQKIYGLVAQFGSYEHYLTNFESVFVRQLQREINLRRKPHHLFEKWHYYTAGGLLVLGAAVYALRNQHEVRALGVETMKSLQFFLNEHLVEPLQNIYETTFKTFHDRSLFSTNAETLAQSKDNLSSMLSEFAHKHASELSAYEERQRAEYLTSIEERARNADMNLVMKPYNREIQHPIRSLLFGDLMHGLLIQVQKVKVDSEAGMLALDQILKSNQINFNILATIPFILLTYGVYDVTNKWILRSSWSSKGVQQQVRVCKNILSELEQIYILHLTNMSVGVEAPPSSSSSSGRSSYAPSSHLHPLSHMRSRSPLHNAIQTLSIDEFASLCSQEQEDEDETLRLHSGGASINSSNSNLSSSSNPSQASMSGTEIFGNLDHVTNDLQLESEDEEDEEEQPYDATNNRPIHSEVSRTLFTPPPPPQQSQSQSHASSFASLRRPSVMGLSNHVYGHTLLLIHSLSLHLSTLPLSSAFTSNLLVRSGGASDPRHVLHKDLVLLASDELTPEQKYRWIQHMWHAYSFLAGI